MIVDMHVHTLVSSPCSVIDPVECIERAIELGLDGICITEHDTHEGAGVVKEIAAGFPEIVVFAGMEVMSREGHLLVYGYGKDIGGVPQAAEIVDMVSSNGGIVVPAHPWRQPFGWYSGVPGTPIEDTAFPKLFSVIEKYNGLQTIRQNARGKEYCDMMEISGIGGSDAHRLDCLGVAVTEFEDNPADERELAETIKSGRYEAKLTDRYFEMHEE